MPSDPSSPGDRRSSLRSKVYPGIGGRASVEWEFVDLPSLLLPELLEAVGLPTALGLHLEGRCLRASVAQRDVAGVLEAVEEALQAVTTNEEEQSEPEPVDPSLLRSTGPAAGQDIYERDLAAFLARNRRRKRP